MAVPTARLYLLCFASRRFRKIKDTLIEAFIHLVDQYEQQSQAGSREIAAAEAIIEASGNLKPPVRCSICVSTLAFRVVPGATHFLGPAP